MVRQLRVVLVDPHMMFRDGLRAVLQSEPDLLLVGEGADSASALRLVAEYIPDAVVLALHFSREDSTQTIARISARHPTTKIIVLTQYRDDRSVHRALEAGAHGYILKTSRAAELVSAIRTACAGGNPIDPEINQRILEILRTRAATSSGEERPLSEREIGLLHLLAQGKTNGQIAATFGLSPQTVKNNLSALYGRLGAKNRFDAVAIASRKGLLEGPE